MGLEVLGDLVLEVGADISPAEQALSELPTAAQQAGSQIDAALGNVQFGQAIETAATASSTSLDGLGAAAATAAQPLGLMDSAMGQVSQDFAVLKANLAEAQNYLNVVQHAFDTGAASAGQLADAANKVQQAYVNLNGAAQQVSESGSFANQVFSGLLGTFAAFTAAELAVEILKNIGEGLAEIATSAVESYAQMERFEVEMGRLTGSTEQASIALNNMKTLAASTPFSFEELAKGEQRMTAFGISTGQVTRVMRDAMDAAAATSNSFTQISNALERVEVTGSINARQLNQLGISWEDLARTAGRSVNDIQEAVKKGGEGAAYDMDLILRTVETKFFGAAQTLATTLQGEFQVVKNQITLLLGGIGEDLAPMLKGLMTRFQDTLLPAFQNVADGLNALAPAFTLVTTAAEGFMSIAAEYITAIGNIEKAVGYLGDRFRESAETDIALFKLGLQSVGVEQGTLDKVSSSAQYLWEHFGSLTKIINTTAEAFDTFDAAAAAMEVVTARNAAALDALKKEFAVQISALGQLRLKYTDTNDQLTEARKLYDQIQSSTMGTTEKTALLAQQQDVINKLWKQADPAGYAANLAAVKESLTTLTQTYSEHNAAVQTAARTLAQAQAAYDAAKASGQNLAQAQAVLVAAENQYISALKAADSGMKSHNATLNELSAQYDVNHLALQRANATLAQAQAAYDKAKSSGEGLAKAETMLAEAQDQVAKATQALDPLIKQHGATLAELQQKYDSGQAAVERAAQTLQQAQAAYDGSAKSIGVLSMAQENFKRAVEASDPAMKAFFSDLQKLNSEHDREVANLQKAEAEYNKVRTAYDNGSASITQLNAAIGKYNDAITKAGSLGDGVVTSLGHIGTAAATTQAQFASFGTQSNTAIAGLAANPAWANIVGQVGNIGTQLTTLGTAASAAGTSVQTAMDKVSTSMGNVQSKTGDTLKSAQDLGAGIVIVGGQFDTAMNQAWQDLTKAHQAFSPLFTDINTIKEEVPNMGTDFTAAFQNLTKGLQLSDEQLKTLTGDDKTFEAGLKQIEDDMNFVNQEFADLGTKGVSDVDKLNAGLFAMQDKLLHIDQSTKDWNADLILVNTSISPLPPALNNVLDAQNEINAATLTWADQLANVDAALQQAIDSENALQTVGGRRGHGGNASINWPGGLGFVQGGVPQTSGTGGLGFIIGGVVQGETGGPSVTFPGTKTWGAGPQSTQSPSMHSAQVGTGQSALEKAAEALTAALNAQDGSAASLAAVAKAEQDYNNALQAQQVVLSGQLGLLNNTSTSSLSTLTSVQQATQDTVSGIQDQTAALTSALVPIGLSAQLSIPVAQQTTAAATQIAQSVDTSNVFLGAMAQSLDVIANATGAAVTPPMGAAPAAVFPELVTPPPSSAPVFVGAQGIGYNAGPVPVSTESPGPYVGSGPITLNATVQAGTVVGGGINDLARMVGNELIDQFRRAGLKF